MTVVNKPMDSGFSSKKTSIFKNWITGRNNNILDIGCYDGRDSAHFVKGNNTIYGIEILKDKANKAKKRGIDVKIFDLDKREKWPFNKSFFDYVVAGDIIEHVIYIDDFMKNICNIIKPGGKLLISTPNIASLGRRLLLLFGKNPYIEVSTDEKINGFPAVGHVRYFTLGSLMKLLKAYNFEIEESTSDAITFGPFTSTFLAKFFPSIAWRLIIKAKKI